MWSLIRKDLLRRWHAPIATLAMLIFPLFMSVTIGSIMGSGSSNREFPVMHVLVENRDTDGALSGFVMGALGQEQAKKYIDATPVDVGTGEAMMEKGKASALLIFPENFTEDVFNRRATSLTIVRNPSEGIMPEIAAEGAGVLATYLDNGARLLGDELSELQTIFDQDRFPDATQVGAIAAGITERIGGVKRYLLPPVVAVESTKGKSENAPSYSIFGYVLVMTTVMAVLFVAVRSIGDLFEETKSGMLRRQLSTPLPLAKIVAAKLFFGVVLGVVVTAILAVAALLMRWIDTPVDLWASILLTIVFSAAACGILALIFALTRNEKQSGILSWLVIMGMSAVGGSLIPVEAMPAAMRSASRFTVNYWVIDGYKAILFKGATTAGIANDLFVLLVIAAVTLAMGQSLLTQRLKEVQS
jgi:ABC-2 type transport system permease protein